MKKNNMEWMKSLLKDPQEELHENIVFCTHDIESKGYMHYHNLVNNINDFLVNTQNSGIKYCLTDALERCITKEVCEYVSFEALYRMLFKDIDRNILDKDDYQFVKRLYKKHLGITDNNTLEMAEKYKLSCSLSYSPFSNKEWYHLDRFWSNNVTFEDKASFKKHKQKGIQKKHKQKKTPKTHKRKIRKEKTKS